MISLYGNSANGHPTITGGSIRYGSAVSTPSPSPNQKGKNAPINR